MKKVLALILTLMTALALFGCASGGGAANSAEPTNSPGSAPEAQAVSSEAAEKVLRVAMTTGMGDLDPFAYTSVGRNTLRYFIYEYLASYQDFGATWETMDWQLAKNITQVDDMTYRIEIYDYISDAIGNPITASDVAFCFDQMATNGKWARFTRYMKSCAVVDDYTVELVMNEPVVGGFEYLMCQATIVSEKTYAEYQERMATTPITTAVYQVTECVTDSYYVIEKNENYWQKEELRTTYNRQPVDKMIYNIITEASQATIALQTGEVDVISVVRASELDYFIKEDRTAIDGYSVTGVYDTTPVAFATNQHPDSIFADNLELRQALCYAIDVESVIKGALKGHGVVSTDLALAANADHDPAWDTEDYYDYDLNKAKELMAAAGYANGIDPATNAPLHLRFITNKTRESASVIIQAQLMQLGVEVELIALDDSMFSDYQYDPARWDIVITKQGGEAYLSNIYDGLLIANKDGLAAKFFTAGDSLQNYLAEAHDTRTHSAETVDALHDYVKDNAVAYGLYNGITYTIGREGCKLVMHPWGVFVPSASDFSGLFS